MFNNPKTVLCKKCKTRIYENEKICPTCGMINQQPFFKKEWFIAILIILFLAGIGYYRKYIGNRFLWDDIILSSVLPEPTSDSGKIGVNSDNYLSMDVYQMSKSDYNEYVNKCQAMGFGIEEERRDSSYYAYNKEGYKLSLWYDEDDRELSISLDAPIEMNVLQWPNRGIVSLLPVPDSDVGKIISEDQERFFAYVGDMTKDDYNTYVNECYEKGFSSDYYKSDTYYNAKNKDGYEISVSYEGYNVIYIRIVRLEGATPLPEDNASENTEMVDGMRSDFKDAMDSYEAFYTEYCDIVKAYTKDPSNQDLIDRYAAVVTKQVEMDNMFTAWGKKELNEKELKYYLEVHSRVADRLLEISE
jgi:hypothetical protein